ncbi:DUF2254 domain-containing protein [Azospirillum sp. RWY-5-1]|uniref:DUF2254 domain-containing protein n=1 Tax=Azospirillum oleiclasticum TaxID=2735135 RepID=A0ABX2T431_9PROT|nr:DUF2254 domain-containing protein [Azospirillum oleiclasticum]NYZ11434.1 DUF2254 domain-containing protein [Azospirillum oleiclasticum]NYZ18595.1 DUF2254 domain-containing protein [Azospirillum oleiclasticum]
MNRLRHTWMFVRTSLWFVPVLMGAVAVMFAVLMVDSDFGLPDGVTEFWLIYSGDADSARELMSALLSGMITMTSLVVSITMVVLTLAAGQIGPRLIRTFIQDRVTQGVLGLFLADILYLLVVFRTIDGTQATGVPHLAVTIGTALTMLCLFVLLFFIHKLARSIIYDNVVQVVAAELDHCVRRLLPERPGVCPTPPPERDPGWVALAQDGYVQEIDTDALVDAARRAGAILRLHARPGHYVLSRGEHVAVEPASTRSPDLVTAVRGAFIIGSERTPTQDLEFGIRQLVEMSTRALSPGINDVFTALAVIDSLSSSLGHIFERGLEPSVLCDADGRIRVVRSVSDYDGMVGAAFDQIRQTGAGKPAVLIRLADSIARLAPYVRNDGQRRPLLEQLDMIAIAAEQTVSIPRDHGALKLRCAEARRRLEVPRPVSATELPKQGK